MERADAAAQAELLCGTGSCSVETERILRDPLRARLRGGAGRWALPNTYEREIRTPLLIYTRPRLGPHLCTRLRALYTGSVNGPPARV